MAVSDLRINSAVRSVLARHWVDLQRIRYGAFRGAVRFSGELQYPGQQPGNRSQAARIDTLEQEVTCLKGVSRVYFDVTNWSRNPRGEWECLDDASSLETLKAPEQTPSSTEKTYDAVLECTTKKPRTVET